MPPVSSKTQIAEASPSNQDPLVQGVPSLGPGAGLLLEVLLTVSAGYALRSPSTLALRA